MSKNIKIFVQKGSQQPISMIISRENTEFYILRTLNRIGLYTTNDHTFTAVELKIELTDEEVTHDGTHC